MKVLLVDDSPAIRASFGELLGEVPGAEMTGWAEDIAGAIAMIEAGSPQLVVLDVELRGGARTASICSIG